MVAGVLFLVLVEAGCGSASSTKTAPAASTTPTSVATTTDSATMPPTTRPVTSGATTTRPGAPLPTSATAPTTKSPATVPYPGTIHLVDSDNGTTVRVVKGTTIVVALSSTYWMFPAPPNAAVLQMVGAVTTMPAPIGTCVPGGGCGTVSVTYTAVGAGQATIDRGPHHLR